MTTWEWESMITGGSPEGVLGLFYAVVKIGQTYMTSILGEISL